MSDGRRRSAGTRFRIDRRHLLGALAAVGAGSLSGCLGALEVPTATGSGVRACGSPPEDPDPREVCPGREFPRVAWSVDAGPATPVRMTAGRTRATLPVEELRFALYNRSGRTVTTNPYGWRLWRWTGGGWRSATRGIIKIPAMYLPHGESYTWRLTATPGDPQGERPHRNGAKEAIRLDGLPAGTYAFGVEVDLDGKEDLVAAVVVSFRRQDG